MKPRLAYCFLLFLFFCPSALPSTYYIDSTKGDDANSGTSADSAWRTLAKVNSFKFSPGDTLLLKRGSLWREQLNFPSSGSAAGVITIDAYGSVELPLISGADLVPYASWTQAEGEVHVWRSSVNTQPNVVIFDGVKGQKKTSVSDISSAGDWYWESKALYVYSDDNPATSYTHGGVESGARPSALNFTGISYVSIRNIATSGANAIPYGEGAGIWAVTFHLEGPTPGNLTITNVTVSNGAGTASISKMPTIAR